MAAIVFLGTASYVAATKLNHQSPGPGQLPYKLEVSKLATFEHPENTSYDYWARSSSLWTCSALLFLVVALINYVFSFAYVSVFWRYREAKDMVAELDGQNCEIPGMFILTVYSTMLVLTTGTFCIGVYLCAFLYKIIHLVMSLVCPIGISNMKRGWAGIPNRDFSHYEEEFDFEANINEQPDYWNATGPEKLHTDRDATVVMNNDGADYGLTKGYLGDKHYVANNKLKKDYLFTPEGGLLEEDDENTGLLSSTSRPLIN